MYHRRLILLLTLGLNIVAQISLGQRSPRLTLLVKSESGEALEDVYVQVANQHGFTSEAGTFEGLVPTGSHQLRLSLLGFKDTLISMEFRNDTTLQVELGAHSVLLRTAEVLADRRQSAVEVLRQEVLRIAVTPKKVAQTPALLGEPDILRPLLYEPGVQSGLGGSSDLYVRGSGLYQNQLYLDDFRIFYQPHGFGYFSPIPVSSVEQMTFYKEAVPVSLEGTLSSAMRINLKKPSYKEWDGSVGWGLGTLRGSLSLPLEKEKSGLNLAGRVSNVGMLFNFLDSEEFDIPTRFGFDDIIGKYQRQLSDRWSIKGLFYRSSDFLEKNTSSNGIKENREVQSQNQLIGISLHRHNKPWQWQQRLYWNRYGHQFSYEASQAGNFPEESITNSSFESNMNLVGYRTTWKRRWERWRVISGLEGQQWFRSEDQLNAGKQIDTISFYRRSQHLHLHRVYGLVQFNPHKKWAIEAGLRLRGTLSSRAYALKPLSQVKIQFAPQQNWAFYASWDQGANPVHRFRQEQFGQAADLPFLSSKNLPPQQSSQAAVGLVYKQSFWQLQSNLFYRDMSNLALRNRRASYFSVFNERYIPGTDNEPAFFSGRGESYGAEMGLKWAAGIFSGAATYAYTKSVRRAAQINNGNPFPFEYNHPHTASAQFRVRFKKNNIDKVTEIMLSYLYGSGQYTTIAMQRVPYQRPGSNRYPNFNYLPRRNNVRLPPQNLLNIGINFIAIKKKGRVRTFNISVAHLALSPPVFRYLARGSSRMTGEGMFPLIPSFSYQLNF